MAYGLVEGRQRLLDVLGDGVDRIGQALTALGAAYEQLDQYSADTLEQELFGPVQLAYGRAKRAHADFASRHGLSGRDFESASPGLPSTGAHGFIDNAVAAVGAADGVLGSLQDMPELLEVGDAELRAQLSEIRGLLGDVPSRARELVRRLGR